MSEENKIILGTRYWDLEEDRRRGNYKLVSPMYGSTVWSQTPFSSGFQPRSFNQTGLYANSFHEDNLFDFSDSCSYRAYGVVVGSGKTFIYDQAPLKTQNGFRSHHQQIIALFTNKHYLKKISLEGKENVLLPIVARLSFVL